MGKAQIREKCLKKDKVTLMTKKERFGKQRILKQRIRCYTVLFLLCMLVSGCAKQENKESGNEAADQAGTIGETGDTDTLRSGGVTAEFGQLCMWLPEGYDKSTTEGLFLSKDYPQDQSNVYLYTTEKENDFLGQMQDGQENFAQNLRAAYEEQYGIDPEISILRYEQTQISGYDAYVIELIYMLREEPYHQLEYIIDADQTYYVAFSQVGNYEWMELFRESAAGMYFVTDSGNV